MFRDTSVKFNYKPEYPVVEFELVGGIKAAVQNERDGLALFIQGFPDPVAYLDLFYQIEKMQGEEYHREASTQIVVYDTQSLTGDPVAFVKFESTGTRVAFETGVSQVETDKQYGAMYGYENADSGGSQTPQD